MTEMDRIEHIVFDLGGVLIDWDGVTPLNQLTEGRLSLEDARRFWFLSPWIARFEKNECTSKEFAEGIVEDLSLKLTPDEFIQEFLAWNKGFQSGCTTMLKRLRERYTLSCLTNNNTLYINDLTQNPGLKKKFDHLSISYQTGFLKPTSEAFEYVIDKLNSPPETILFFDDNIECVYTAKRKGLVAYQVKGCSQVVKVLTQLKLMHN